MNKRAFLLGGGLVSSLGLSRGDSAVAANEIEGWWKVGPKSTTIRLRNIGNRVIAVSTRRSVGSVEVTYRGDGGAASAGGGSTALKWQQAQWQDWSLLVPKRMDGPLSTREFVLDDGWDKLFRGHDVTSCAVTLRVLEPRSFAVEAEKIFVQLLRVQLSGTDEHPK